MNLEEAIDIVDMWTSFKKPRANARGLSAAAAVLAEEVRRRHGIGGELIAARRERDSLLAAVNFLHENTYNHHTPYMTVIPKDKFREFMKMAELIKK